MRAFFALAAFELRYQLRGPVFVATFALFGLLTFGAVTVDNVQIGASNAVNIDSPFAITSMVMVLSLTGLFIPTAMLSSAVLRDLEMNTAGLVFSTPVRPWILLLGRFVGGFAASALAFASVPLAAYVGAHMPWLDPEQLGGTGPATYAHIYLLFGVGNLFACGLVLFTVANLTRSTMATYVTLVAFLVLYLLGVELGSEPAHRDTLALVDPLGVSTVETVTRYWTPIERNTQVAPLQGVLLANRLLWLGIGLSLLLVNVVTFRFAADRAGLRRGLRWPRREAPTAPRVESRRADPLPRVGPDFTAATAWRQLAARIRFEVKSIVRSLAFWILLALGLLNGLGGIMFSRSLYGLSTHPVTRRLLDILEGSFEIIPIVVIIYYAGELMSRDLRLNTHELVDATPVPSWALFSAKLVGLTLVVVALMATSGVAAIAVQLAQGYTELELGQYAVRLLLVRSVPFVLLAVLSLLLQVVAGNRWLGMLAMLVFFVANLVLGNVGFEDRLYRFPSAPPLQYSDLNGFGQFLPITATFLGYHACLAVVMGVLAYGLWTRGMPVMLRRRVAQLPVRVGRVGAAVAAVALLGAGGLGTYIFHNTHVLNDFTTRDDRMDRSADYERTYGSLEAVDTPKVVAVAAEVDIFPVERSYVLRGRYGIENRTEAPVTELHVDYPYGLDVKEQALQGARLSEADPVHQHFVFALDRPWHPGERRSFRFVTERCNPGFKNDDNASAVAPNGTFFSNTASMPVLGFAADKLLEDRPERRERGLPERPRAPKLEDERFHDVGALKPDSDWVTFTTTVSTRPDQVAVAPGYLEAEWEEGDRRFFRYAMDAPIQNFFAYLSADYTVVEDEHRGVTLQVFHHAPHTFNVDRMLHGMKRALDYGSESFSPFQYRQMRIFEFPRYIGSFAQSFPNSVPYSEAIGFIVDIRDVDEIDAIFYVTAHEVAHQWFGHQLSAAPNQGATMLIETFAQYMALMVMKREYGEDAMRRFLKYELDSYLSGRGTEVLEELPLYRVEDQPYVHYRKGALAMYALQDYMGEDRVNAVIRRLIEEKAFSSDPYPVSTDFLTLLKAEATEAERAIVTDLFERIVLFDLEVEEATAAPLADGRWSVELTIRARKLEADGKGRETEVPLELAVDVGVFSRSLDGPIDPSPAARGGHVLALEKRTLTTGVHRLRFVVDERPVTAGVDPYNKLVDRDSEDNLASVTQVEPGTGAPEAPPTADR